MKPVNKKITSFSEHLDAQYGKTETETRKKYEEEYRTFYLSEKDCHKPNKRYYLKFTL